MKYSKALCATVTELAKSSILELGVVVLHNESKQIVDLRALSGLSGNVFGREGVKHVEHVVRRQVQFDDFLENLQISRFRIRLLKTRSA